MFLEDVEKIIQQQGDSGLDQLLFYYGVKLQLFRPHKSDVYSRIHKTNSGTSFRLFKDNVIGILQDDDFFPSNSQYAGGFEAGFLYTKDPDILVGDVVGIKAADVKVRQYKITAKESIGNTREVFKRYKLSAIGD